MKEQQKLLKKFFVETKGFSLAELLLVITLFGISVVPIYKMVISSVKVQKSAEETYEATLNAQNLLQMVQNQIEKDIKQEYEIKRGILSETKKKWLEPGATDIDPLLIQFLEIEPRQEEEFNKRYQTDNFLYEVHIWPMMDGKPEDTPISFTAYKDSSLLVESESIHNPSNFTKIEIDDAIKKHFSQKESLLWTDLGGKKPIGIAEITHAPIGEIEIKSAGMKGHNITLLPIDGYSSLGENVKLSYARYDESIPIVGAITHQLVIEDISGISSSEIIQLSVDLTTYPSTVKTRVIRIENKTQATLVVPVYSEKNLADIEIYPIQYESMGNIVVEKRNKLEPSKNFVIGVIVRDGSNSTFGDKNKILSKVVDVYSCNYNKQ